MVLFIVDVFKNSWSEEYSFYDKDGLKMFKNAEKDF